MAHFALLNENNVVVNVYVIMNQDIIDENNTESEILGINLCKRLYGIDKRFVQTSYNNNFRNKYACIGDYYDEIYDAFITPPLYESFVFNATTLSWEPPIPYPGDPEGIEMYRWDESILSWVEIPME